MLRTRLGLGLIALFALSCSSDTTKDRSGDRLYATVSGSSEVVVIDEQSHEILETIPVGKGPAIIVATPDHKKVYTANWADDSISMIETATNEERRIQMDGRPYVIAMAPDGRHLYAGLNTVNQIAVIDTSTDAVTRTIPMDELPASIIVSPDSRYLYVAYLGIAADVSALLQLANPAGLPPGTLMKIPADSVDGTSEFSVETGDIPAWITIGKSGQFVYTLNFLSDDITVVDTTQGSTAITIATGEGSQGIIGNVTPDGSRLYVTNFGTNDVIAIDTATNTIAQRIELAAKPVGVQFNEDGSKVYITDFGPESVNETLLTGGRYLLTGEYTGTGNGQVRAFSTLSGEQIGPTVSTGPGTTSVVFIPAD